ncbi:glycerophosphodiester phosphodiesterase [Allorhodopirellula solitaria]|uniref:Putative glycerophosphoryl diester phosphodiesterase 1 n=1 Tax=Allorhodopirellula solitaria TaxID=2527987 RepID=A0A5C5XS69_9BACT|nr:glycerophosphodiester phosphodiesterase family protein [Allorhodopirellula solitaria]TWT65223.1 putative glycerophosphoryl diester phosphodiesterase 1 [Allorhodopirellula solitaria]
MLRFVLLCQLMAGLVFALNGYADDVHPMPLILAHRGGAFEFEENTMEGFRACYERGIRGYETDIRMTKDGVLVLLHDDSLDRTHNASGPVEEKTAAELKDVQTKKGQSFLLLEDFLAYFQDKPGVYLELEMKTSNKELYPDARIAEYCDKLYAMAKKYKPTDSDYLFTSFDERPLVAMRKLDVHWPIAIIASKPLSLEFIKRAERLQATHIACQISGTSREMVQQAQKLGYKINGWPGRKVEDYYLAIGLGLDVACTDIPTVIQQTKEDLPARDKE